MSTSKKTGRYISPELWFLEIAAEEGFSVSANVELPGLGWTEYPDEY